MVKRILLLAANPLATDRLRIDEEIRAVKRSHQTAQRREDFELHVVEAARVDELRNSLLSIRPHIFHFLGHGLGEPGIVLEDDDGKPHPASASVLSGYFRSIPGTECVVLNACYTEVQAEEIAKHVQCVISSRDPLLDKAAIAFSSGFYDAIFHNLLYADAFEIGCLELEAKFPHESHPTLVDNEFIPENIREASISKYIGRYKGSKTFTCGIIDDIETYSDVGATTFLRATDTRHVVIIDSFEKAPFAFLTEPNQTIGIPRDRLRHMVFVFLNTKPQRIKFCSPRTGYLLADGEGILVDFELKLCITNAEQFWRSNHDPIDELERQVTQKASHYFLDLASLDLVDANHRVERIANEQTQASQLRKVIERLQQELLQIKIEGVQIENIYIDIRLPKLVQAYLDRRVNEIYGANGILERQLVNERIDHDPEFAPYSLRDVIRALDYGLLENFYVDYHGSLRKVREGYTVALNTYQKQQNTIEIERLAKILDTAISQSLSDEHIQRIKERIGARYLGIIDLPQPTDQDFLKRLVGNPQTNASTSIQSLGNQL